MNVFCLHGADPEVQAYALAKYSRSSSPMIETIQQLDQQKAESFLNSFYFAYGHRSIADLCHVPMVMESISMLAAIEVVDESRWDGQERSTRYQDFSSRKRYVPSGMTKSETTQYSEAVDLLFEAYESVTSQVADQYRKDNPKPEGMKDDAWERTIMARTFDVSRYLLPLSTETSVGQITSARTLEGQISRLLSSPVTELQQLAEQIKQAARGPAYNVNDKSSKVAVAPTLVKYAEANPYQVDTRAALTELCRKIMGSAPIRKADRVTLIEFKNLEEEIVCSLLYEVSHYPMRQIRGKVRKLNTSVFESVLTAGVKFRGSHDELYRPYRAGYGFTFDIYMDIGGFRDMHRHRRCIQLIQDYNFEEAETPDFPAVRGIAQQYRQVIRDTQKAYHNLRSSRGLNPIENYILPLGAKKRMLMKMDFAEVVYIAELRTTPAGHISYRRIASDIYHAVKECHPTLMSGTKIHDIGAKLDFFKR